jgi:putative peptide zinc metalloprotease protein
MSEVAGPEVATGAPEQARPPRRADGVTLIGEMTGSGYRVPPALVRRADGQTVQLTPLLYATLAAVDGRRTYQDLAEAVSVDLGRTLTEGNVVALVDKLRPLGLVESDAGAGGAAPVPRSNPLLALRFKVAVTEPERTRRLTDPFARLFHPMVAIPVLTLFAWTCWWVLLHKGLASATHDAFARPGLLLAVLAVTVLSAGFHEFGHAAATRRGGATPGVMGAGLYLVWPAFYTDVTDSYRLGKGGRLRTDLGGLYFNAIVTVLTVGVWLVTGYDAVLLIVATQILQMLRQLLPLVRFDGYHVLADVTGVPDLFQRIGPTLRSLVPGLKPQPSAMALKPWARLVITAWVLMVVPVLGCTLVLMVLTLPRIVGTALHAANLQRHALSTAADSGALVELAARAVALVVVLLPVVATAYMLARVARQVSRAVWRRTSGRPARRAGAVLVAGALVAGLAFAWWPSPDRYRPVQAYEGGTLGDALGLARPSTGFTVGSEGRGIVALPAGATPPTRDDPELAIVLVPTDSPTHGTTSGPGGRPEVDPGTAGAPSGGLANGDVDQATPDTWVFPFDEPLAPDADDNQALAVNTTDGTATYDVAFALIWADPDQPVQTSNEAYAFAHCNSCAAVAVSFQVVLVVGNAAAVAPENVSVSATYDCTSCLTFSLAVQLFVTLDGPLSDAAMDDLTALWADILAFGEHIGDVPLDELQDTLSGYEEQILAIIEEDQGPLVQPSSSTAPTEGTATPSEAPTSSDSATSEPASTSASPSAEDPSATASSSGPSSSATSSTGSTNPDPGESASGTPSGTPSPTTEPTADAPTSAAASTGTP